MSLNIEPLIKILDLEQKRGFNDSSVFGGLDRFLANWIAEFSTCINSPSKLKQFRKIFEQVKYRDLSVEKRAQWINQARKFLTEVKINQSGDKSQTGATKRKKINLIIPQAIDGPITNVKGISTNLAAKFEKLGVKTIRDLLYFFPHRHIDYSQQKQIKDLVIGEEQTIIANVWEARIELLGNRKSTVADIGDETGNMRVVWFNNPYLAKQLPPNSRIVISGKVSLFRGRPVFENPEWEPSEVEDLIHTGRIVPVYSLTSGMFPRQVRRIMKSAVEEWAPLLQDFLPEDIKKRCKLDDLTQAIKQAHYPDDQESKDRSRRRLAFDELFLLQLGVLNKKRSWQAGQPGIPFSIDLDLINKFILSLPFKLTVAQERVLKEITTDLAKPQAMSRLLQGDVGSGKTVIASIILLIAAANGFQGAMMAPTEILAEQHFKTLYDLFSKTGSGAEENPYIRVFTGLLNRPVKLALLTGSMPQLKKESLQEAIKRGEIDIVCGTHSLIQEDVIFSRLGLAVIDEQHRFGVEQRSALRQKGYNPHVLVMTATPIPRTLALTLYGDLDLSIIDELPPGRQIIKTRWLKSEERESAYQFIRKQVSSGHQAFIICPLIEESETIQAKAAKIEYERLSTEVFPDLKLGLLHGKLSSEEKDKVMQRFRNREFDILVATPVIEVGIDIPNATVMLVESAERFGLSQLHQFRGRVGRGTAQSYCILLADNPSEIGRQRLDIIEKVHNGFILAEEDLKLRGPGEFFGTRQSGLPDLRMAKLSDAQILEYARREAIRIFEKDPGLQKNEHSLLLQELIRIWPKVGEWS